MAKFASTKTPQERLAANCIVSDDGCWNWKTLRADGRANAFYFDGKYRSAYRAAYLMYKGDIPEGFNVNHTCDNPACVNPDHLWSGTQTSNARDMVEKGRNAVFVGEAHGQSKVTADVVRAMRADYAAGDVTLKALASRYGLSVPGVHHIILRRTWKHVE